jgi:hypothetical protein
VSATTAEWVAFVADIVRRGQRDRTIRSGLDPESVATVLVGAFDGVKALIDVLAPPERAAAEFADRVQTLLAIVEAALIPGRRGRGE